MTFYRIKFVSGPNTGEQWIIGSHSALSAERVLKVQFADEGLPFAGDRIVSKISYDELAFS